MLDFIDITYKKYKDVRQYYPEFIVKPSKDLMVRGGEFYAIWDEENDIWSTDKFRAYELINKDVENYCKELIESNPERGYKVEFMDIRMYDNNLAEKFSKYLRHIDSNFKSLDSNVTFSNTEITRSRYSSFKLDYPLEECPIDAYEELMSTLYAPEERQKLEWAIGSIIQGDSKKIQKFFILYGDSGTGKSTFLNILQWLFDGYCGTFEAKSLGSGSEFGLEALKSNPLVAIDNEADLSRIFDNTRLNSIVAHEKLIVNAKYTKKYEMKFNSMLFMGSNKPVQMTDSKTGLKRRLIDISPTGNLVPQKRYNELIEKIHKFERPGIAWHCLKLYEELGPRFYNGYEPVMMFYRTNAFFNFVEDSYLTFKNQDYTTLKQAYDMYKQYMADNMPHSTPMTKMAVRDELDGYFREHKDEATINDVHVRHLYSGFKKELFDKNKNKRSVVSELSVKKVKDEDWLDLKEWKHGEPNVLNEYLKDCKAQYATKSGTPNVSWTTCRTKLSQLDCSKEHYVNSPENLIVIDFDIKNADGEKDFELNKSFAIKWPKTYAETSKSGGGIHLHYLYSGDVQQLQHKFDENIEVKVYTGDQALRRKLIKCNSIDIATISSGLPLKERMKEVVSVKTVKNANGIRRMVIRNLNKEFGSTTVSMHFIEKILDEAYESGVTYDISDLKPAIVSFAANSTNQAKHCLKLIDNLKFKSADLENLDYAPDLTMGESFKEKPIAFYDVEVFPNLFLVNWKFEGKDKPVTRMINPTPEQIEELVRTTRLVGFNCRRYDNHMLWARMMGYTEEQLFKLSQRIISTDKKSKDKNCFFGEAWNLSYTDVYDYAKTKQSLKKWEIQLKIHHQELGLPWDKPVPKELWEQVAEYCDNDVIATEAVWNETQGDFKARCMLVKLVEKMHGIKATENDTTNSLSTKIIFGNNKKPQSEFIYTDLSEEFPGYEFDRGVSHYKGFETGEGGMVWSDPGIYGYSKTFDVTSMHPSTIIALNLFGDKYTKVFADLVELRKSIKHGEFDKARKMFDGALAEFLDNEDDAGVLGDALKIVINSIYGLTSASFENAFRDPRNIDNIVAKRGALFMINLKEEVEKMGYKVFHIKTDSIKVANPDERVERFISEYGAKYGYGFEVEHEWEKICLINDAVYIGKVTETDGDWLKACKKADKKGEPHPTRWTATGTQFAVPYVFKTLFSHEPLIFDDYCETKSVTSSLYLDFNEDLPDVTMWETLKSLRATKEDDLRKKDRVLISEYSDLTDEELDANIAEGHNYHFVGKVGLFCPVVSGAGGGILLRDQNGKFYSATGADGFRWKESETVRELGQQDMIDIVYYETLVAKAIAAINQFGDFGSFVDPEPLDISA